MNFLRNLFGKKQAPAGPANFVVTEIRELPLQKLDVSYEGTPSEISRSYSSGHQNLEPLLDSLVNPINRNSALLFFKKLNIDAPGVYNSPYEVFKSTISLITTGKGDSTLTAWAISEQSLGSGSNVLVVLIDHPLLPMTLVCCKIDSETYLAYYGNPSIPTTLGLK